MKRNRYKVLVLLLSAGLLALAIFHVVEASQTLPAPAPPAEPPRTPFGDAIAGAGIVEPETENIALGSALAGVVLEVYVPVDQVGKQVKSGDPLFRVDDRHLRAQLEAQKANLASARAQLTRLERQPRPEEVPASEAQVAAAEANLRQAVDQYERDERLRGTGSVSQQDHFKDQQAMATARAQQAQAKANLALLKAGAWDADKMVAQAAVDLAAAQLEQTQVEIERALVRAPVAGKILQVNVRLGEYVGNQAGQALFVLGAAHQLHVRVDIDERDVDRFRPGLPARAITRGAAHRSKALRFVRVEPYIIPKKSLTGDNTERVDTRVLQVIYALERAEYPFYVGQQVDVFVDAR